MECKHIQEKIMQYIHHDLAGDEQSAFERHVRECSGCQEFVRQENEFTALLNEHITMSDTLPEGLRKSVEQMVQEYGTAEANEAPGVKWTWPQLFPALGVLSVIILVLCVTVPQKEKSFNVFEQTIQTHQQLAREADLDLKTSNMQEALAWLQDRVDFDVGRPHIDPREVQLIGVKLMELDGRKVVYFAMERRGEVISAYYMDYSGLKSPRVAKENLKESSFSNTYMAQRGDFSSIMCHHKHNDTACILVGRMPSMELVSLMG